MNPRRRFRKHFRNRSPLQQASRTNLPLQRLERKQKGLNRMEKRLNRLLGVIGDWRASLKELMEEDTPYRIMGRFNDKAQFNEPRSQRSQEEDSEVRSRKPRRQRSNS